MVIRETSARLLRQLNSRWIYGRIPLLHAIIFLAQVTMVSILIRTFNHHYGKRPVLTSMITNAVLGGIADSVAQTLTAYRVRQAQRKFNRTTDSDETRDSFMTVDLQEIDRKVPWPENDYMNPNRLRPPPFDFERLVRFMSYGFIMAPVQHKWFKTLSGLFPMEKGMSSVLKSVAFDQLLFAPVGLGVFFTFMTVAEGGGKRAVVRKFQDVYIPALKANFMVWPAVQLINFRLMPLQFRIPFVSTIGIAWTAYLSMTNSAEEVTATP